MFWLVFKLSCWTLFVIQALICAQHYLTQKPATVSSLEKQETWPLPSICFGPIKFFNETMARLIPEQNYMEGKWVLDEFNLSEKEVFDSLTPELYDLTSVVSIDRFLHEKGIYD